MNTKRGKMELSANTRKALCVHLGDDAGNEIVQLIRSLSAQIEDLEKNKVNVTQVIPDASKPDPVLAAIESESF